MKQLALLGHPVQHSASPSIHHTFAKSIGVALDYALIDTGGSSFVDCLDDFLSQGGVGGNITVPHKQDAFQALFERGGHPSAAASMSRAVNTFWLDNGALYGDNTDGLGLGHDLQRLGWNTNKSNILIIGAGGAVAGILPELLQSNPRSITILNRSLDRARALVQPYIPLFPSIQIQTLSMEDTHSSGDYDLIIQATPLSLQNTCPPVAPTIFDHKSHVYDLCYVSEKATCFEMWAQEHGVRSTASGYGMLIYQAAFAFLHWFDIFPERAVRQLIHEHC